MWLVILKSLALNSPYKQEFCICQLNVSGDFVACKLPEY